MAIKKKSWFEIEKKTLTMEKKIEEAIEKLEDINDEQERKITTMRNEIDGLETDSREDAETVQGILENLKKNLSKQTITVKSISIRNIRIIADFFNCDICVKLSNGKFMSMHFMPTNISTWTDEDDEDDARYSEKNDSHPESNEEFGDP